MHSFSMSYDASVDQYDVRFSLSSDDYARCIPLNDHIFLYTDQAIQTAGGMVYYSFSRLLGVSETEFSNLQELDDNDFSRVIKLIGSNPCSYFLDITNLEELVARVNLPTLSLFFRDD